ncbi:hypothetical protein IJG66_01645 [Candidatus Saccharibacteria bacterium]|nr:hypothetical protein [Candidatus Saccharibacteria bacterium]
MKRTKKHILGVCGLVLVAALTAIAATIPAPKVSAAEQPSDSADTTVQVLVTQRTDSIRITSPADGAQTDQPTMRVDYVYTSTTKVTHRLVNKSTGEVFELTDMDYYPPEPNGVHSITLDLNKYGGYGKYVIYVMINDEGVTEDAVSFEYVANITPPDTGSLEVPETNLIVSRIDFVASGVVVFMLVALIAIHIMRRSTRK